MNLRIPLIKRKNHCDVLANILLIFFVSSLFFMKLVFDSSRSFHYDFVPAWAFSFFLLLSCLSKGRLFLNWMVVAFFLFAVLSLFSTLWSVEPSRTFSASQRVMAIAFVLFGFWLYVRERDNVWFFVNVYLLIATVAAVLGIFILHDTDSRTFLGIASGTVGPLFGFAAILGFAGWAIKRIKIYIIASAISIYPVLLVGSIRGAGLLVVFLLVYGFALLLTSIDVKKPMRFANVALIVAAIASSLPFLYQVSPERLKDRAERNYEHMSAVAIDGRRAETVGGPAFRLYLQKKGYVIAAEELSLLGKGLHSTYAILDEKIGRYTYTHSTHWEVVIGLGLAGVFLFYGILAGLLVKLIFGAGVGSKERVLLISIVIAMLSLTIIGRTYTNIIFAMMVLVVAALHDWLARSKNGLRKESAVTGLVAVHRQIT